MAWNNNLRRTSSLAYRPDIDGLRAIAIISVVLFHAGIKGFTGGFVGVDVFFVISGYLITSILVNELETNSFSFLRFWERRVRRIIPVMFFIIGLTAAFAYFIVLFPVDFLDFSHSLIAQSFFLANIFFMRKDSYFAGPSESMPLLHTWTLAVEEQFYIIFPLVLFLVSWIAVRARAEARLRRTLTVTFSVLFVLTLAYSIFLTQINPGGIFKVPFLSFIWGAATNFNAGFFFLPSRAWELLTGSIIAAGTLSIKNRWLAEFCSVTGLGLIAFAVTRYSDATLFPGSAALAPVFGSALIISANMDRSHKTFCASLLSFPPFVWIGLISYSLYLWHWPLLVFSRILLGDIANAYTPLVIFVAVLFSICTYIFIEIPFQKKKFFPKRYQMFIVGFVMLLVLASWGLVIHLHNGFPFRAPLAAQRIAAAAVDENPREYECFKESYKDTFSLRGPCLLGDQDQNDISFVLWGDSHSDASMPVFDQMAKEKNITGAYFGAGGCMPILWQHVDMGERCEKIKQQAVAYIHAHHIRSVILVASWQSDPSKIIPAVSIGGEDVSKRSDTNGAPTFYEALRDTITQINDPARTIYIMKRVPLYDYDVRGAFNRAAFSNQLALPELTQTLNSYRLANEHENEAIDRLQKEGLIKVIDPTDAFCSNTVCALVADGKILYRNGTHLNTTGSMRLRSVLEEFFDQF